MPLSATRNATIGYHLAEGEAWLSSSEGGGATTHLAYAAFELRLEAERIAVELLRHVQGGQLSHDDLRHIRSFKAIEERIYQLEGHQRTLDRKVAFWNVFFEALGLPQRIQSVKVGRLRSIWHACSELCHLPWTLAAAFSEPELGGNVFRDLSEAAAELRQCVEHGVTWALPREPGPLALQDEFLSGAIDEEGVRQWIRDRGLWARVVHLDGSAEFIGTAVPPGSGSPPAA